MKMIRRFMVFLLLLTSLFYFSPQISNASPNGANLEGDNNELEEGRESINDSLVEESTEESDGNESDSDVKEDVVEENETPAVPEQEDNAQEQEDNASDNQQQAVDKKVTEKAKSLNRVQDTEDNNADGKTKKTLEEAELSKEETKKLQNNLVKLGFLLSGDVNGKYDEETKAAVESFQQYYGLTVSGEADEATLEKLDEILSSPFQNKKSHKDTVTMKEYLGILGYLNFPNPTTYYGTQTEAAVKAFQKDNGLAVSGIIDPITEAKLKDLATAPLQKGMYREDAIQVKLDLEKLGFVNWKNKPNDYFGPSSEEALIELQKYYGLSQSGKVDEATSSKMEEILASPFQKGKRHKESIQLKEYLVILGYADFKNPTNYFGTSTEAAVKTFQKDNGLPVSGIIEPNTKAKLVELATAPLEKGMHRQDAVQVKKDLEKLGFVNWKNEPNDYFGSSSEEAVKELQKYYGLSQTGKVDDSTLSKMEEVLASPFQKGKRHEESIQLKEYLVILGYADFKNPTNYFGTSTEAAVKAFQKDNGLPQSGIIEQVTKAKLIELATAPLEKGMHRKDAITLKKNLEKLGFVNWKNEPNDYFGSSTEAAVKKLQKYYGLSESGKVDEATSTKIEELISSPFQKGKRHTDSVQLKKDLETLGYASWKNEPNDYFGSSTEKAVIKFQKDYNLIENGIVDDVTLAKMQEVLNSPLQNGKHDKAAIQLKKDLEKLGFVNWKNEPNDFYGSSTEKAVKDFQKHFGLAVNGIADKPTLEKINQVLSSPLQSGKRHKDAIQLKKNLESLGYVNWKNEPTNYYGSSTADAVREFQRDFGLPVSGIADEITLLKIQEVIKSRIVTSYTQMPISLSEALDIQMKVNPQTDKYRNDPAYVSANYGKVYNGGYITGNPVNLRTSPKLGTSKNVYDSVSRGTLIAILDDNVKGDKYSGSTRWYKIRYDNKTLYVHSKLAAKDGKVFESNGVNVRAGKSGSSHKYGYADDGTILKVVKRGSNWHEIDYNTWRNAKRNDVKQYLDPSKYINDNVLRFQFLDLSQSSSVSVKTLNNFLKGKGVLEGMGQAFIDAGKKHGINELYLLSHALHETGNGTSKLATGIKVNGKTVYNVYGIHAFDHCPESCGSQKAYDEGWFTVKDAIIGGAAFIGDGYINAGQNTLYKMRWNFVLDNGKYVATHQYATDIGWATKQVSTIYNLYQLIDDYILKLDIPQYK